MNKLLITSFLLFLVVAGGLAPITTSAQLLPPIFAVEQCVLLYTYAFDGSRIYGVTQEDERTIAIWQFSPDNGYTAIEYVEIQDTNFSMFNTRPTRVDYSDKYAVIMGSAFVTNLGVTNQYPFFIIVDSTKNVKVVALPIPNGSMDAVNYYPSLSKLVGVVSLGTNWGVVVVDTSTLQYSMYTFSSPGSPTSVALAGDTVFVLMFTLSTGEYYLYAIDTVSGAVTNVITNVGVQPVYYAFVDSDGVNAYLVEFLNTRTLGVRHIDGSLNILHEIGIDYGVDVLTADYFPIYFDGSTMIVAGAYLRDSAGIFIVDRVAYRQDPASAGGNVVINSLSNISINNVGGISLPFLVFSPILYGSPAGELYNIYLGYPATFVTMDNRYAEATYTQVNLYTPAQSTIPTVTQSTGQSGLDFTASTSVVGLVDGYSICGIPEYNYVFTVDITATGTVESSYPAGFILPTASQYLGSVTRVQPIGGESLAYTALLTNTSNTYGKPGVVIANIAGSKTAYVGLVRNVVEYNGVLSMTFEDAIYLLDLSTGNISKIADYAGGSGGIAVASDGSILAFDTTLSAKYYAVVYDAVNNPNLLFGTDLYSVYVLQFNQSTGAIDEIGVINLVSPLNFVTKGGLFNVGGKILIPVVYTDEITTNVELIVVALDTVNLVGNLIFSATLGQSSASVASTSSTGNVGVLAFDTGSATYDTSIFTSSTNYLYILNTFSNGSIDIYKIDNNGNLVASTNLKWVDPAVIESIVATDNNLYLYTKDGILVLDATLTPTAYYDITTFKIDGITLLDGKLHYIIVEETGSASNIILLDSTLPEVSQILTPTTPPPSVVTGGLIVAPNPSLGTTYTFTASLLTNVLSPYSGAPLTAPINTYNIESIIPSEVTITVYSCFVGQQFAFGDGEFGSTLNYCSSGWSPAQAVIKVFDGNILQTINSNTATFTLDSFKFIQVFGVLPNGVEYPVIHGVIIPPLALFAPSYYNYFESTPALTYRFDLEASVYALLVAPDSPLSYLSKDGVQICTSCFNSKALLWMPASRVYMFDPSTIELGLDQTTVSQLGLPTEVVDSSILANLNAPPPVANATTDKVLGGPATKIPVVVQILPAVILALLILVFARLASRKR